MAFTGDLEHLHIVDVIQLIHTTRKTGTLTVKGEKGISRIIFSNGYIVGANHLNNRVRIGSVLVKLNAITKQDLEEAIDVQKKAGKSRKPLITTLIEMGKLSREDAFKGLKELIVMTLVDLIGWTNGTFTLDTDAITASHECSYFPDRMEQEISLDAQMVLMDALRIYDELQRDKIEGKKTTSYESMFEPIESFEETPQEDPAITAETLGLENIDRLEKKIPKPLSFTESFNTASVHRENISETLKDFSSEEQGIFISFLEKSTSIKNKQKMLASHETNTRALILFSTDKLIKHSIMTICKNEGILVFSPNSEKELDSIISQCILKKYFPIIVFDSPEPSDPEMTEDKIITIRQEIKSKYPGVPRIQLASPLDYLFTLQSLSAGIRAVFPKPLREFRKESFVEDTIKFLQAFKNYIKELSEETSKTSKEETILKKLKDKFVYIRDRNEPTDISLILLQSVSEIFDRAVTFFVRQSELIGGRAIGINKSGELTTVSHLKIPLNYHSVFKDVIESGRVFYGEIQDPILEKYLFEKVGMPVNPTFIIIPMKSGTKTVTLTYGDSGKRESLPDVNLEMFEMLSNYAGIALENIFYRKHYKKSSQK
ncbi:MAG: DUF4388 domain-containing protein [Nitrospirae bacterium]|jgi:hypothetical protein|nr:DUF4388 domain-containing protein [Nitrospirota bacterium]